MKVVKDFSVFASLVESIPMFSLHNNVIRKHWDTLLDIMADFKIKIEFKCTKCENVFTSEKTLKEHQRRKRGGHRTGCIVIAGSCLDLWQHWQSVGVIWSSK